MVEKVSIKEYSKHLIIADVCIDGILFNLVLACYLRVRRLLSNVITDILQKHSNDTNFSEQIEDIEHGTD